MNGRTLVVCSTVSDRFALQVITATITTRVIARVMYDPRYDCVLHVRPAQGRSGQIMVEVQELCHLGLRRHMGVSTHILQAHFP